MTINIAGKMFNAFQKRFINQKMIRFLNLPEKDLAVCKKDLAQFTNGGNSSSRVCCCCLSIQNKYSNEGGEFIVKKMSAGIRANLKIMSPASSFASEWYYITDLEIKMDAIKNN